MGTSLPAGSSSETFQSNGDGAGSGSKIQYQLLKTRAKEGDMMVTAL
ncbi:MAG: hypothetical protein ABR564_02840 [Candidatus Dormibacteria bacterium]